MPPKKLTDLLDVTEFTGLVLAQASDLQAYQRPDQPKHILLEVTTSPIKYGSPEFHLRDTWFYSSDGLTFQQLQEKGMAGNGQSLIYGFFNPATQEELTALKVANSILLFAGNKQNLTVGQVSPDDFKVFTLVEDFRLPTAVRFVPVPVSWYPLYLAMGPDDTLYYAEEASGLGKLMWRFYMGTEHAMREVRVVDVMRARDGGSTWINTEIGTFYSPSPSYPDRETTWTPKGIEWAQPTTLQPFDIRVAPGLIKVVVARFNFIPLGVVENA